MNTFIRGVFAAATGLILNACGGGGEGGTMTAAPRLADVLIALDTSAGMSEEAVFVQNELNTFATAIKTSGIDLNIVVVAASVASAPRRRWAAAPVPMTKTCPVTGTLRQRSPILTPSM